MPDISNYQTVMQIKGASNPMFGKKHAMAARRLQSLAKQGKYKGSHHPRASITEEVAVSIKKLKGQKTRTEVSKMLNVSSHVVANIWSGKSWRFVNG